MDSDISPQHAQVLLQHPSNTEGAVEIYPKRVDVDRINNACVNQIRSQAIRFDCHDHFNYKPHHHSQHPELKKYDIRVKGGMLKELVSTAAPPVESLTNIQTQDKHRYEPRLQFKIGTRVVLQHNLDPSKGLVNRSQGEVVGFEPFNERKLPKKHRDDEAGADASSLVGSHAGYREESILKFAEQNRKQPWPVIRFDDGQERTIYADCAVNELIVEEPFSLLSRTQIPLMAGYAITVHKAQVSATLIYVCTAPDVFIYGMTLMKV